MPDLPDLHIMDLIPLFFLSYLFIVTDWLTKIDFLNGYIYYRFTPLQLNWTNSALLKLINDIYNYVCLLSIF